MKSIWNGTISFGLVSIPVRLYSAISHRAVKFRLVHKKDNSPIKYKKYCEQEDREVAWQDIAKAVEVSKGNFYVLNPEELNKLKPEKTDAISVLEFVDSSQLDPIYFDSHYFIAPSKLKDKAYFLFKRVLQSSGKVAIGKFIMKEKEYTCVISSYKNGLLLTTLNYQYEIKNIDEVEELRQAPQISEQEMQLAQKLIEQLTKEEFNISQFKDTFEQQLKELIKRKEKGEPIKLEKKKKKKEENLIVALRKSLK